MKLELFDIFVNRPDLLDDEKKLKSTFSDFYAGNEAKIRRMMKAYEIGVLTSLVDGKTDDFEKKRLIDRLVNLHDMREEKPQISNLYEQNVQLKNNLNQRTTILMVISAIAVIIGLVGIIL